MVVLLLGLGPSWRGAQVPPLDVLESPRPRDVSLEAPAIEPSRVALATEGVVPVPVDPPLATETARAKQLFGSCRTVAGQAVPDVQIRYRARQNGDDQEPYTIEGESDELGDFSLDLPGAEFVEPHVSVLFTKAGFAARQASYLPSGDERGIDLGVVLMEPGGGLEGTVSWLGTGGPVGSASLAFTAVQPLPADNLSPDYFNLAMASSDDTGKFRVKYSIPAGEYSLRVRRKDVAAWSPATVRVLAGVETHVAITVEPSSPIRGRVVGESGPLEGLRVSAWDAESDQRLSLGDTTDSLGSFELWPEGEPSENFVKVDLESSSSRDFHSRPLYVRWGSTDAELHAERIEPDWVEIHFQNADLSRPIHMCEQTSTSDLRFEEVSVDAQGVLRIDRARRAARFALFAQGPSSYSPRTYDLADASPIEVEFVSAGPPVAFHVVDDVGDPVEGAMVECVLAPGSSIEEPKPEFYPSCFRRGLRLPGLVSHWVWEAGTATADGRSSVHVPDLDGWTTYWRVRADGFSDQAASFRTGAQPVDVRLTRAAAWQVVLTGYWPTGFIVVAESEQGAVVKASRVSGASASPRQEFLLSGLDPQSWHIHVRLGVMDRAIGRLDAAESHSGQIVADAEMHVSDERRITIEGLASGGEPWQLWLVEEGVQAHAPPAGKPLATTNGDVVELPRLLRGNHRVLATSGTASKLGRLNCSDDAVKLIAFD